MKKQKNIIQFTPYFFPHIGGVEKVVEEISGKWTYGETFIVSGNICQQSNVYYKNIDNTEIFFLPGIDIVDNFFIPAFWTKKFWTQLGKLKKIVRDSQEDFYILTHTRFFPTSFLGGVFSRFLPSQQGREVRWIHIEHGSDYVKLSSSLKTKIAYFYDRTIGKWILKKADIVVCISEASKKFVEKEFGRKDVEVWYRGIDFTLNINDTRNSSLQLVFIGRLVTLKGVDTLIDTYKKGGIDIPLTIIGDGEEKTKLQELSAGYDIVFLGMKDRNFIEDFLSKHTCILVNPSYQEGLPTTVIEGLMTKNVVIATDVGGTKEISDGQDLQLFLPGNTEDLGKKILFVIENFYELQGKSYDTVREKFSREKSIEKLYNILD